jgi:hypothetical protein
MVRLNLPVELSSNQSGLPHPIFGPMSCVIACPMAGRISPLLVGRSHCFRLGLIEDFESIVKGKFVHFLAQIK